MPQRADLRRATSSSGRRRNRIAALTWADEVFGTGNVVDGATVSCLPEAIRDSAFQIAADCFLAALTAEEHNGVMMRVNHSCEPNVGMGGNVLLVSMREIAAGEELTIDYALFLADPGFAMDCRCRAAACRGVVRDTDWTCADLRERYQGWFSWWLQQEITQAALPGGSR
jgi:hypothetical protein